MNWRLVLSAFPLLLAWVWTWWHLSIEWRAHPHYEYGWGVPVLFAVLVWQRWGGCMERTPRFACVFTIVGMLGWMMGEAIRQHDPIWRIAGGLMTAGCTLLSAGWLLNAGGWALLRRQGFALVFAWMAVPWPMSIELVLTQRLLHLITSVSVFCATVVGFPVLQHGNTIEVSRGIVGVDEACSGIQSLQAALMATLFLTGYLRLGLARGIVLGIGSFVAAMLGNLARVLALVSLMSRGGPAAVAHWHDPIGTTATLAIFAGIYGLAVLLRRTEGEPATPEVRARVPLLWGSGAVFVVLVSAIFALRPALGGPVVRVPFARIDPRRLPEGWTLQGLEPKRPERALLGFSEAEAWIFRAPDGRAAWLYHFLWDGDGMPPFAFSHTPGMCMPWSGWIPVGEPGLEVLHPAGDSLPATSFTFTQGNARVVAFQIVSSGGQVRHFTAFDPYSGNRFRRLVSTWRAPREHIDEEILLYVPDLTDHAAAIEFASDLLGRLLTGQK